VTESALSIESHHEGETSRVLLKGEITEAAELDLALEGLRQNVILDLSGIKRVNSFGVRNWVKFIQALAEKAATISLEKCATSMVRQFNMVPTTRKGAAVTSVFLPYYCGGCDDEREVLLPVEGQSPPEDPPEETCPTCGEEMEFDEVPESYFAFWSSSGDAFIDQD
jgi:anti-anti-sigma regulatory factor